MEATTGSSMAPLPPGLCTFTAPMNTIIGFGRTVGDGSCKQLYAYTRILFSILTETKI